MREVFEFISPEDKLLSKKTVIQHLSRYTFTAGFTSGKTVLDIGCGCGYGSWFLAEEGARKVVALDKSEEALGLAQTYFHHERVCLTRGSATRIPFGDAAFETVVATEIIEHLEEPDDFLEECKRVLIPGGLMVCSTPPTTDTSSPCRLVGHVNEFTPHGFTDTFSRHFAKAEYFTLGSDGAKDAYIARIASWFKARLHNIPYSHKLVRVVTKVAFRDFQLVRLTTSSIRELANEEIKLNQHVYSTKLPISLVAVGKKL